MGLYTACVLAELEAEIDRPIARCFDLIAGTSIGGIIALGLAAEVQAGAIRNAIAVDGPRIFSRKPPPQSNLAKRLALLSNARRAKYRAGKLRTTITSIIDEKKKIGHLQHRVMVPAVNLTKGSPQVFKTDHRPSSIETGRCLWSMSRSPHPQRQHSFHFIKSAASYSLLGALR